MLKNIGIAILGIAATFCLILVLKEGIRRDEVAKCLTWREWSKEYNEFYLTVPEDEMCRGHGIVIEAFVRG